MSYGSDVFTGGTASASTETEPAAEAFDDIWDSNTSRWYADAIAPEWLKYDLGAGNEKRVERYKFQCYISEDVLHAKDWTFDGSNNDSDWDTLDTQSGITWSPDDEKKTFSFSNTTSYRYYRLNITAYSGESAAIVIVELEGREWKLPNVMFLE